MHDTSYKFMPEYGETLSRRFGGRLRVIAKSSVTVWFAQDRLDKLLTRYIGSLEGCRLLYAIDRNGKQISSNIHPHTIDTSVCGQDLSERPYVVNLSVFNGGSFDRVFEIGAYKSSDNDQPCMTVMHGVTSGDSLLGFIAADFHI